MFAGSAASPMRSVPPTRGAPADCVADEAAGGATAVADGGDGTAGLLHAARMAAPLEDANNLSADLREIMFCMSLSPVRCIGGLRPRELLFGRCLDCGPLEEVRIHSTVQRDGVGERQLAEALLVGQLVFDELPGCRQDLGHVRHVKVRNG